MKDRLVYILKPYCEKNTDKVADTIIKFIEEEKKTTSIKTLRESGLLVSDVFDENEIKEDGYVKMDDIEVCECDNGRMWIGGIAKVCIACKGKGIVAKGEKETSKYNQGE